MDSLRDYFVYRTGMREIPYTIIWEAIDLTRVEVRIEHGDVEEVRSTRISCTEHPECLMHSTHAR